MMLRRVGLIPGARGVSISTYVQIVWTARSPASTGREGSDWSGFLPLIAGHLGGESQRPCRASVRSLSSYLFTTVC